MEAAKVQRDLVNAVEARNRQERGYQRRSMPTPSEPFRHYGADPGPSTSSASSANGGVGAFAIVVLLLAATFLYNRFVLLMAWTRSIDTGAHPLLHAVQLHPAPYLLLCLFLVITGVIATGAVAFLLTLKWFRVILLAGSLSTGLGWWFASLVMNH